MTLSIRGHEERGGEVISLLEMFGGRNTYGYAGTEETWRYFINAEGDIDWMNWNLDSAFTLEEFEEKFPFKVGSTAMYQGHEVIINGMEWCGDKVVYHFDWIDDDSRKVRKGTVAGQLTPVLSGFMEEDRKKAEDQIARIINEFNQRHNVEVNAVGLDYWRYESLSGGSTCKYASVKFKF